MAKNIVIYEPMFFPWLGFFEQIKFADVFVFFDNIQFPQGKSFANRCQIKTKDGVKWMTIPIKHKHGLNNYNEVEICYDTDWRNKHFRLLEHSYSKSKYCHQMLEIVHEVYDRKFASLSELSMFSSKLVSSFLGLKTDFRNSSDMQTKGSKSELLVEIVSGLEGDTYITGLGGANYLDYQLFEKNNITVRFMDYMIDPYPQNFGDFTPYVSILDTIANCSRDGVNYMMSTTRHWSEVA